MPIAWHEFSNAGELDTQLASALARHLADDLNKQGRASLAVSGGSTPIGMFRQLAGQTLNWQKVAITLVDERHVPPDHRDSNERLVRENLLRECAQAAEFVGAYSQQDAAGTAASFEATIRGWPPFSALVLGMGTDGHTASWFADSPELDSVTAPNLPALAAAVTTPSSPHPRVTLTLAGVLRSKQLFLHITGSEKRQVLDRNLTGQAAQPISRLLQQAGVTVHVYWAP